MRESLLGAETLGEGGRYSTGKLYKKVLNPDDRRRTQVRISTSTELRLGGTYPLEAELSRSEIAELFFETHSGARVRMLRAFIDEEQREDYAEGVPGRQGFCVRERSTPPETR
jgi:hypothetical protein